MAPFMLSGFRRWSDDFMTTKNSLNTVCTQKSSSLCLCLYLCLAPVLTLFPSGVASLLQASHTDAWRRTLTEPGLLFWPSGLQKLTEVLFKSHSVTKSLCFCIRLAGSVSNCFKNISLNGVIYKKTTIFNHDVGLLSMGLCRSLSVLISALTLSKKKQAASVPGLVLTPEPADVLFTHPVFIFLRGHFSHSLFGDGVFLSVTPFITEWFKPLLVFFAVWQFASEFDFFWS